jgi:predicted nucleic acid-binding protein
MSDELNDELESVIEPTEEVVNTEEVEVETPAVETEDKSLELEEKNRKLFERAKKAEAELKELRASKAKAPEAPAPVEKQTGLTPMDAIVLSTAKITDVDDIEEVVSYAKFKGIEIKDALKDKTMQTILRTKAEERQTAEATNTGGSRRGAAKPSDEQLLANARSGKSVDDIEALAEAHFNQKFN